MNEGLMPISNRIWLCKTDYDYRDYSCMGCRSRLSGEAREGKGEEGRNLQRLFLSSLLIHTPRTISPLPAVSYIDSLLSH